MPVPSTVTTCIRFGYSTISVRTLTFASLNLSCALRRFPRRVDHGERDFGLAGAEEFQVVDGAAGHLRGRLQAGNVLGQDVGHAAAHRVVDTAGAAGGDRNPVALLGDDGGGGRKRSRRQRRKRGAKMQVMPSNPPVQDRRNGRS